MHSRRAFPLRLPFCFLLFAFLSSCANPTTPPPSLLAADTPLPSATIPPSPTPESSPAPTDVPALPRPRYTLNALLDYARKTVAVEQTILYPNQTGETLSSLVLAVVPNLWPNCFSLTSLTVDGLPVAAYNLQNQRLELTLPQPLAPGAMTSISLQYALDLPFAAQPDPNEERPRIFGYTQRQINLTNWYPFVVPYEPGRGWMLHEPWFYGEHLVYDAADFEVNLRFTDPASAPVVAASGLAEPFGAYTRYTLTAGRTFALSASPEFDVASLTIGDVTVYSYYFPLFEKGGQDVLQVSAQSVQLFAERYGSYPHKSLSAVMGDFNDGMEFSALYFLPRDFYNFAPDTPQNYLTFVAVHETAHQWWFEQVASDQAMRPWLDEALSTYSERIYYEAYYPDLVSWWWAYRIDFYQPQGWVDTVLYDGGGFRPYTNAVYLRGAHFLEDLRARIGDEAFFAFLQDYLSQMNGKIATPQDFFAVLRQHTSADLSDLLQAYFLNPY